MKLRQFWFIPVLILLVVVILSLRNFHKPDYILNAYDEELTQEELDNMINEFYGFWGSEELEENKSENLVWGKPRNQQSGWGNYLEKDDYADYYEEDFKIEKEVQTSMVIPQKNNVTESSLSTRFINAAKSYLETPYLYGGTDRTGLDCSGFVYLAAKDCGLGTIPRSSSSLYAFAVKIQNEEKKPGDLLFFADGEKISHVGIYLGENKFIHAASDGTNTGVVISRITDNYWKKHYVSAGRIVVK